MRNRHQNLVAYDLYETSFINQNIEMEYRRSKLESCEKHVSLLTSEFDKRKINILEIGSGNSKLLINLSTKGILNFGWGIEISKSRYEFSQRWIDDLKINNIKNFNDDIINFDFNLVDKVDVCICVDLCFQFLEPIKKNSSEETLYKIFNKLEEGGKIILELDYCGYIIDSLPYTKKIWEEFSDDDPWKYSLWDCNFNLQNKTLNWKKTFISRDGKYEGTEILLRIFNKDEIVSLLNKVGFKNIRVYKDWSYSEFERDFDEFVIIAEK